MIKKIRYRPHSWIDTKCGHEMFGVQAKIEGRRGWMHVADGEPLRAMIFDNRAERDAYLAECRSKP